MTRYKKDNAGNYIIHGHKYEKLEGSRAQVVHGTAFKTSGELTKKDLLQNKNGRIVSRKKHVLAKKEKRLVKAGYGTRKGHFGAVRLSGSHSRSSRRSSSSKRSRGHGRRGRKMRGGSSSASSGGVLAYNSGGPPSTAFSSVPANVTNMSNASTYN